MPRSALANSPAYQQTEKGYYYAVKDVNLTALAPCAKAKSINVFTTNLTWPAAAFV